MWPDSKEALFRESQAYFLSLAYRAPVARSVYAFLTLPGDVVDQPSEHADALDDFSKFGEAHRFHAHSPLHPR